MKNLYIAIFAITSINAFAQQKPLITDAELVKAQGISEIEFSLGNPEGELYRFITANQITGTYIFDITVRGKGLVATVFAVNSNENDVKKQNLLKDKILSYKFNFRMPKGKMYKFQYTFIL